MNKSIFDMPEDTVILSGADVAKLEHLLTPPHLDTYIRQPQDAAHIYKVLSEEYADDHQIEVLSVTDGNEMKAALYQLVDLQAESFSFADGDVLHILPAAEHNSLEYMQNVVAVLRAPNGCPWDRKQTHQSLRDDFLQEVYEFLEGVDQLNVDEMMEELGDILLHIFLQAQIAQEAGEFNMGDVNAHISDKLIFRHEHVFGNPEKLSSDDVLNRWELMKKKERDKEHKQQGLLDGISKSMPALSMAFSCQERAARVGFDWTNVDDVWAKLDEEIAEFRAAETQQDKEYEMGDILFCVVNLARWYKVDPETSLREANYKFRERVHYVEAKAKQLNRDLFDMPLEEKDKYWDEYKASQK